MYSAKSLSIFWVKTKQLKYNKYILKFYTEWKTLYSTIVNRIHYEKRVHDSIQGIVISVLSDFPGDLVNLSSSYSNDCVPKI